MNKLLLYYIKSDTYSDDYITKIFPEDKWIKVRDEDIDKHKQTSNPIDYIYLDGKHYSDILTYNLYSLVKNIVSDDKRQITQKHNLISNLSQIRQAIKFVMPQFELDLMNYMQGSITKYKFWFAKLKKYYSPDNIYIFKPVSEYAGKGIEIITNFAELIRYINKIITQNSNKWNHKTDPALQKKRIWVLQEYLVDPLLINGYKFHIRHYLFYVPGGTSYYLDNGEIAQAREKYICGDWHNPMIHDTHFHGGDGDFFPEALHLPPHILKSINDQISALYSMIMRCINARCYPENKHCYELFGVDFMITRDYKLKVIEINSKLGMPSEKSKMSRIIFEGSLNKIVLPILNYPKHEIPKKYTEHFIAVRQNHTNSKTHKSMTWNQNSGKKTLKK